MDLSLVQIEEKIIFCEKESHGLHSTNKYRGVRFEKKDDYLLLYEEGFDCVLKGVGEDEYIVLKNTYLNVAMNEILDIFDMYLKWDEKLRMNCQKNDFDGIVDCSWDIFVNPLIIRNNDIKLLAISRNVDVNSINNEYRHLSIYGYSSLSAYKHFADVYKRQDLSLSSRPILLKNPPNSGNPNMLCGIVRNGENVFARVFVVEYNRKICEADYRNLQYACSVISENVSDFCANGENNNLLNSLLNREVVSEEEIEKMYAYWDITESTTLRVITIKMKENNPSGAVLMLFSSYAAQMFDKCLCVIYRNSVVVLLNEDINQDYYDKLKSSYIYENNETLIGISLKFCGIKRLYEFYDQCMYCIKKGFEQSCEKRLYDFYYYGADYIVNALSVDAKICATMPEIKKVFYERKNDKTEIYHTMHVFAKNGFSFLAASEELGVHKNTVLYRIEKFCKRKTHFVDINDPYIREYMLISMRVLENNSKMITSDKYNKF